ALFSGTTYPRSANPQKWGCVVVQVSYPGVYVVEVPSGVHTITGVSTSIAAFFGSASNGPLNKAVRCLSMADFTRTFGDPHPDGDLAQGERTCLDNGGPDCYVVRMARNNPPNRSLRKAAQSHQDRAGTDVLVVTAKSEGVWGSGIKLEIDYNP